jgi:hypothetical protein
MRLQLWRVAVRLWRQRREGKLLRRIPIWWLWWLWRRWVAVRMRWRGVPIRMWVRWRRILRCRGVGRGTGWWRLRLRHALLQACNPLQVVGMSWRADIKEEGEARVFPLLLANHILERFAVRSHPGARHLLHRRDNLRRQCCHDSSVDRRDKCEQNPKLEGVGSLFRVVPVPLGRAAQAGPHGQERGRSSAAPLCSSSSTAWRSSNGRAAQERVTLAHRGAASVVGRLPTTIPSGCDCTLVILCSCRCRGE